MPWTFLRYSLPFIIIIVVLPWPSLRLEMSLNHLMIFHKTGQTFHALMNCDHSAQTNEIGYPLMCLIDLKEFRERSTPAWKQLHGIATRLGGGAEKMHNFMQNVMNGLVSTLLIAMFIISLFIFLNTVSSTSICLLKHSLQSLKEVQNDFFSSRSKPFDL